jgi:RHS repeat-associated protein
MKPKEQPGRGGLASLRLLVAGAICLIIPLLLFGASGPAWWYNPAVTVSGTAPLISGSANDYAAVNQGQVKNIAVTAINELNTDLAQFGGAGPTLNSLKTTLSGTSATTNDFAAVNLGQLKALSKPFFDRLIAVGYTQPPVISGTYPWIAAETSGSAASDYAMANIGQVKNLFSFDVTSSSADDGIPDWWTENYFDLPSIDVDPTALAPADNGFTNLECYMLGIDPLPALAASYSISLSGTFSSSAAVLTANVSNATSPVQSVTFYQGDSLLGTVTTGSNTFTYQYPISTLPPGNYSFRAVSVDQNGAVATATYNTQVGLPSTINQNWWYLRGMENGAFADDSYVVPVDYSSGVVPFATGTAEPTGYQPVGFAQGVTDFMLLQPTAAGSASPGQQWQLGEPWFLQIATSGTEYHLTGTNSSGPIYSGSLAFTNPVVAFGSQAGGTPLYTGQTYSFGVVSGGQNLNPALSGTLKDLKIDIYAQSSFASGTASNVAPVATQTFHLPRPGEPDWDTFAQQGYQLPLTLTATSGTNFTINVQYAVSGFGAITSGTSTNYPLLFTVSSSSAAYYLRISVMGAVEDPNNSANSHWDWMAVDSLSNKSAGDYSASFTMDFTQQGLQQWQSTLVDHPSFAGTTPLPAAYQGMSEEDLLNVNPIVTGSDSLPATVSGTFASQYLETGTNIATVTSPELVDNPILDNFVKSMNCNPMALANYVQNEIGLVDALAVPNSTGTLGYSDQSVNFGGVNRSALGVLLEGEGSPVEQCGLLVYLLRKARVPCGYVFGPLDQTQMLSTQLSEMLRTQLNGAEDFGVEESGSGATLIPVNYPWVAAYINGQWVHLFPWIKDTVVDEGYNLYDCLPQGYKTGGEWVRQYLYNDPKIRTRGTEFYENPGVLFPQFVENNLPANLSIDDVGVTIYNRPHYYTAWSQFPHPWSRPGVSGTANLYTDLMSYSSKTFGSDQLFDTASVQVFSDRAGTGAYVSGTDPMVQSGTLYTALLDDRRFLLYHTPAPDTSGTYPNTSGTTAWGNYNMNLSLEAATPIATGTNVVTASGTASASFAVTGSDQYFLNKQFASYTALSSSDNNLYMVINLTRHRAAESNNGSQPFLGIEEAQQPTDTRPLQVGDTAAICFNFGQVTHWMLEAQEDKYWAAQQQVLQNSSTPFDIETTQGLPAYLMGMSYYYREGGFINQYQALTKLQIVSSVDHGLAKLSPARISGSATLVNGQLNLRYPNVDMYHLEAVWAGNATVQPGSGNANSIALANYFPVFIAASSAQENLTIQQFFAAENDDAVSTIKLMDIASALTLSGTTYTYNDSQYGNLTVVVSGTGIKVTGTSGVLCVTGSGGMIELNNENYRALGQLEITGTYTNGTVTTGTTAPLSWWATNAGLWSAVTNAFTLSGTNTSPEFHRAFITAGPVSGAYSGTGSSHQAAFYGMGALIYGIYDAAALISPNLNGADGSDLGESYPDSAADLAIAELSDGFLNGDDAGPEVRLSDFTLGDQGDDFSIYTGQTTSYINYADNTENVLENWSSLGIDPETSGLLAGGASLLLASPVNLSTANGYISASQEIINSGGLHPTNFNTNLTVGEPVNTVTGEFYDDSVDLKLNGPMPLEIRRNYGSQNPFSGAFGYGWKISMTPYLVVSTDSNQTLIYAAEMDGSVLIYRRQSPTASVWLVSGTDNPQYINPQSYTPGAPNLLNNRITVTTSGTNPIYTLAGADGSLRTFQVQSFPTAGGTNGLNLTRPYLQKWQDNRGNYFTFSYGTDPTQVNYGQVTSISASNGNYAGFMYDTYGHITQAYTGDGNWTYYQYDDYGDLTQVTLPDNSIITYSYRHQPDPNGNGTFYSEHLLTQENRPGGRVLQNYYDYFGFRRVLFQNSTIQQGNSTPVQSAAYSYALSATNNTPIVFSGTTFHTGTSLSLSGNTSGYSSTLTSGGSFSLTASTLLSGSAPLSASALLSGTTTLTDVNGNSWIYSFANGNFTEITSPPQNRGSTQQTITQQWASATATASNGVYPCSLESYTDKRGLITTYQYDTQGNLIQKVLEGDLKGDGNTSETGTTTMSYNNSVPVTLPGSTVTAIPNTIASVTDPLGNSVSYTYGNSAYPYLPTSITKATPSGTVSTTLLQYGNASSGSGSTEANAYGLLQQETIAQGTTDQSVVEFVNNGNGFPTSSTQYSETSDPPVVTYYTYDLRGEVTSETDAAGRNTQYQYDPRGNQTGMLRYDEYGNLASWQFNYYNQNGEIEWTQGPRFSPDDYVQKEYDGAGRLSMVQKCWTGVNLTASGLMSYGYATTFNTYDTFGNLRQVQDPNGNITSMSYDDIGEMYLRQLPNLSGSESFTYEPGGKVATHTTVLGGTETYSYTSTGLLMSGTMADGSTKSYLYDLTGRVLQETLANGSYWTTAYDDYNRKITRRFYNSSTALQGTESQSFDRRGNAISKTDLAGNVFSTTYDGLNRVKSETGPLAASPSGAGSTAQQSIVHTYDAAGVVQTVTNALGERTVTTLDALERPTEVTAYNSNGTVAATTRYVYSPDHQSVTTIQGSGSNGVAVASTVSTDTNDKPVLLRHADGTSQETIYDANGNKTYFIDEEGASTHWTYDALNHPLTETLPADPGCAPATISFSYNAAGELLSRQMPEGLTAETAYDAAGRKVSEELLDTGGTATRQYAYTYYPSNSGSGAATGLLESVSDPRGFTMTTTYDAWMRPSTVDSSGASIAQQNQNTTYGYDIRGMVNSIAQSYVSGTAGPSTLVTRGYDGYGQMNQEAVSVSGTTVSDWYQSWDGGGRRTALDWELTAQGAGAGSQYGYSYNAAGLLTGVVNSGSNYAYSYGDNGLLEQRSTPLWTKTITRDIRGRVAADMITGTGNVLLSESNAYNPDSQLSSYAVSSGATGGPSETRRYTYDGRERLWTEPYAQGGIQTTGTYWFDIGTPNLSGTAYAGGLPRYTGGENDAGLGVRILQYVSGTSGYIINTQDGYGRSTGDDYQPGGNVYTNYNWEYDAAGNATQRLISSVVPQDLTWDAWGRLVGVSVTGKGSNNSTWTTVYDGLGRRVQTNWLPVTGSTAALTYYYDPEVEFLELGNNNNGSRTWKVYGPDVDGMYGSKGGTGGLEAMVTESSGATTGEINNCFGDAMGTMTGHVPAWSGHALGGYGAEPGSSVDQTNLTPEWRGHYLDIGVHFYYLGARYYEPRSGRFLSPDPLGHAASMSLYDYCAGDPVNGLDPLGLCPIEEGMHDDTFDILGAILGPQIAKVALGAITEAASSFLSSAATTARAVAATGSIGYALSTPEGQYLVQTGEDAVNTAAMWGSGSPVPLGGGNANAFADAGQLALPGGVSVGAAGGGAGWFTPNLYSSETGAIDLGGGITASASAADDAMQVGYHATNPANVQSILDNGFYETQAGRLGGGGVYVNNTQEGAIAEYLAHNPGGPTPTVLQVQYNPGLNYNISLPTVPSTTGPLSFAADTITAPSVRLPGTLNTIIRNGSAIPINP